MTPFFARTIFFSWANQAVGTASGIAFLAATMLTLASANPCALAQESFRDRLRERIEARRQDKETPAIVGAEKIQIAGLNVAVWRPKNQEGQAPLLIFSHGFRGMNIQSAFLMKAFADAGYLVMAPNHKDATAGGNLAGKPEEDFKKADRGDDIKHLVAALHKAPEWNSKIDWSKVALAGHSLGGYTALACAGAWPTWKLPEIKAVLALSPYAQPFVIHGSLDKLGVPVMYQGGTMDFGITPFVKRPGGAFSKTSAPAYFVEFSKAGHLFWTGFNRDLTKQELIDRYSLAFLNKYVKGEESDTLTEKLDGVSALEKK
jgi:predicted dienelactone hydrolase